METNEQLRKQGAFISVSNPFDRARKGSWDPDDLLAILPYVDAIEIFNARCMLAQANQQAQEFARQHSLAGTAGADAHTLLELDRAVMRLPKFINAISLRQVLDQANFEAQLSSPLIHFTSRWAVIYKTWKRR
jgi:predicted metal-dependent phosphoesterase TrpH